MPLNTRELFARLLKCEAGGEGDDGMRAVASVIMNRANIGYGEFGRVSNGGDIRKIIEQQGQFDCLRDVVGGRYNAQTVWNMTPDQIHYDIADWAIAGNIMLGVDNSLFYFNPFIPTCRTYFPAGGSGIIHNRIHQHCFYIPTEKYRDT